MSTRTNAYKIDITPIKYWFSVVMKNKRDLRTEKDPTKRWKLSPMDIESRARWVDYSRAKDEMFKYTNTKKSPWRVVKADDKKKARLNCIRDLLSSIPYRTINQKRINLPEKQAEVGYSRPSITGQTFVKDYY